MGKDMCTCEKDEKKDKENEEMRGMDKKSLMNKMKEKMSEKGKSKEETESMMDKMGCMKDMTDEEMDMDMEMEMGEDDKPMMDEEAMVGGLMLTDEECKEKMMKAYR